MNADRLAEIEARCDALAGLGVSSGYTHDVRTLLAALREAQAQRDELRAAVIEWREAVQHQNDDFDPTAEYDMDPGMARVLAAESALVRLTEAAS